MYERDVFYYIFVFSMYKYKENWKNLFMVFEIWEYMIMEKFVFLNVILFCVVFKIEVVLYFIIWCGLIS